eukprot:Selendium_serpulae@DN5388_c0_g1_i6.p3
MKILQATGEPLTNREVIHMLEADQANLQRENLSEEELRRRFSNKSVLDYLTSCEFQPSKEQQLRVSKILIQKFGLSDSEVLQTLNSQPKNLEHLWLLLASGEGEAFQLQHSRAILEAVLHVVQTHYSAPDSSQMPEDAGPV